MRWVRPCAPRPCRQNGAPTAATILAENGATEAELMRVFGWKTSKQATYYIRKANAGQIIDNAMTTKWEMAA